MLSQKKTPPAVLSPSTEVKLSLDLNYSAASGHSDNKQKMCCLLIYTSAENQQRVQRTCFCYIYCHYKAEHSFITGMLSVVTFLLFNLNLRITVELFQC